MADDAAAKVQLSLVSVAYALLFYYAFAVLALGLANRVWRYLRLRPPLKSSTYPDEGPASKSVRLFSEVVFLRSFFFNDRWAWIFAASFHLGLLLVLLRHLRYALDPSWAGPLWIAVRLVQPFGFYGGFALLFGVFGFWGRRMLLRELRQTSSLSDYLMLALFAAIPLVGYMNNWVHTDVIAVKSFFIGLALFHWQPLPSDPLLLIHLWLVAAMMVALPFSKVMHVPGLLEEPDGGHPGFLDRGQLRLVVVGLLGLLLLAPAGVAGVQVVQDGWTKPQPEMSKLARIHKSQEPTVMIRNHPNLLLSHRSVVVYTGKRVAFNTIENCVTCHEVKGDDGQPVSIEDPRHFCRGCHNKAAVTIDCFECHNSKPVPENHAAIDPLTRLALAFPDHPAPDSLALERSLAR